MRVLRRVLRFNQTLDLSYISHLSRALTTTEINIVFWIGFSSFIRSGNKTTTKMFSFGSFFWVRLKTFWTTLVHNSSSSWCHAISTDIPDPLSPHLPIVHCFQDYIPYQHRAAVCRFELDILPLLVHVKGSTGVHHSRACLYFSSSVPHVWFV